MKQIKQLTGIFDTELNTFETEVIQASHENPVLVDFWADWCAPCIAIAPILEKVIPMYNGKIMLARLEVDEGDNMKLAGHHKVRGFPTIMLFQGGEETARFSGSRPGPAIHHFIHEHTGLTPD